MRLNNWLSGFYSRLFAHSVPTRRPKRRHTRPRGMFALECLESRRLLTTFSVNTFADTVDANPGDGIAADSNGETSLRAALMEANALAGEDTIELPAGTYSLSLAGAGEDAAATGDLDVLQSVRIEGVGQESVIIDAEGIDRVFDIHNSAQLTLLDLTLTGGKTSGVADDVDGGGIRANNSPLTVQRVTVDANEADGEGGGIFVSGALAYVDLENATLSNNVAGTNGGGMRWDLGPNFSGSLRMAALNVTDNTAGEAGGGLALTAQGGDPLDLSLVRSTFSGNMAGTDGGGIYLDSSAEEVIAETSQLTVSGNTAVDEGGGIYFALSSDLHYFLLRSTVTLNTARVGGGLFARNAGTTGGVVISNSIIYGNSDSEGQPDVGALNVGQFAYGGGDPSNFIGDTGGNTSFVMAKIGIDPLLGPLADNGGPTPTHALLPGSPALDAGNGTNGTPEFDQRFEPRVVDGNGDGIATTDSGAVEMQVPAAPVIVGPKGNPSQQYGQVFTTEPTFRWEPVAGAVHYDLWVNNLTTGESGVIRENVAGTEFTPEDALPVGHAYVWTVSAVGDNGIPGPQAPHAYFQIRDTNVSTTLLAPLSGPDTTPTFEWEAVPFASSYDIWVNDLNTGESGVIRTIVVGDSYTPETPLVPGHAYIWTVQPIFPGDIAGQWAEHRTFRVKFDAPTLLAPENVAPTGNPEFRWSAVEGADHYDLWVNDLTTGESGVIRVDVAGTSYTPPLSLVPGHDYIWTVAAVSDDGYTGPQAIHDTFVVAPPAGLEVTLLSPGPVTSETTPTFEWTAAANADHYELWVNNTTTGESGVILEHVSGTSFVPTTPLPAGHNYIWTVRAVAADGTMGLQAAHQRFVVAASADLEVTLIGPGLTTTNLTPTFEWTEAPAADHYDLWVNDLTTGESGIIRTNVTGTSFTPETPLPVGHDFVWTVRAIGADGSLGAQAEHLVFSIRADSATLIGPPAETIDQTPTLNWAAAIGAHHYELQVDDLTTGENGLIQTAVTGTSFTPETPLPVDHEYRWTVRALNADGSLRTEAAPRTFSIRSDLRPTLIGPDGSLPETAEQLTFEWTPVPGAARYELLVNDLVGDGGPLDATIGVIHVEDITGTSLTIDNSLDLGHVFDWSVRAISDNGLIAEYARFEHFYFGVPKVFPA